MPTVKLDDAFYELEPRESLLDCLLRHAQPVAYACKSGVCQSCLVKVVAGTPEEKALAGLKPTLRAQGYALSCQWRPQDDVEVRLPGAEEGAVAVTIAALDKLNEGVMRVKLRLAEEGAAFDCRPGQYVSLINADGVSRSYSIANDLATDGYLELHVGYMPGGLFTTWLFQQAAVGDELHVRGPAGHCFYVADEGRDHPLLLAGTGTGLAPLYGIARAALAAGHEGPVTLLHGSTVANRLYYVEELAALAAAHANFTYDPCVLDAAGARAPVRQGDIVTEAMASIPGDALKTTRLFLCGAPTFVQKLRKQAFLKGVSSSNIYADAFVTRADAA